MFVFVSVTGSRGLLWRLVHDLIYNKINKMAAFFPISLVHIVGLHGISFSLFTEPSDGEHKEQPVQRPAQQQQQQQQQQCSPGATTHHPNSADASHDADPQPHAAQPATSTPTSTTTPVPFGRVSVNSPHHLLTSQRPHGRRRLAQGGREETRDRPMH
jgi:hypothetical protein